MDFPPPQCGGASPRTAHRTAHRRTTPSHRHTLEGLKSMVFQPPRWGGAQHTEPSHRRSAPSARRHAEWLNGWAAEWLSG